MFFVALDSQVDGSLLYTYAEHVHEKLAVKLKGMGGHMSGASDEVRANIKDVERNFKRLGLFDAKKPERKTSFKTVSRSTGKKLHLATGAAGTSNVVKEALDNTLVFMRTGQEAKVNTGQEEGLNQTLLDSSIPRPPTENAPGKPDIFTRLVSTKLWAGAYTTDHISNKDSLTGETREEDRDRGVGVKGTHALSDVP